MRIFGIILTLAIFLFTPHASKGQYNHECFVGFDNRTNEILRIQILTNDEKKVLNSGEILHPGRYPIRLFFKSESDGSHDPDDICEGPLHLRIERQDLISWQEVCNILSTPSWSYGKWIHIIDSGIIVYW